MKELTRLEMTCFSTLHHMLDLTEVEYDAIHRFIALFLAKYKEESE